MPTGYNAGGFNARACSVNGWQNAVDQEEVISYEVGMNAERWERRPRTNIAAFYNGYDDIQIAPFDECTARNPATDEFTSHPFNNQFHSPEERWLLNVWLSLQHIAVVYSFR